MTMPLRRSVRWIRVLGLLVLLGARPVAAGEVSPVNPADQVRRAVAYLDGRQDAWSKFASAGRGTGEDRTTCVSCHTGISYALARPSIGKFLEEPGRSESEERTMAALGRRVEHWAELDSPRFRLMYDFDDRKKIESRGTEAVLNALLLARADSKEVAAVLPKALTHLWETQESEGADAGSWAWLQFGLEPWEGAGSRGFGAALAAIAVSSAPGYLDGPLDDRARRGVDALRDYLRRRVPSESLHNRLWFLEASRTFPGFLPTGPATDVLDQVRTAQRPDGGWSLTALGNFQRVDGSTRCEDSEGYATGLALHALMGSGVGLDRPEVARGLDWLRTHQRADGSWPGISVNKERDPATFTGKLMIDAATAFAARSLVEASPRGPETEVRKP